MPTYNCDQCHQNFDDDVEGHQCENCYDCYCDNCANTWFYDVEYKDESAEVCALCTEDWVQNQKENEEEQTTVVEKHGDFISSRGRKRYASLRLMEMKTTDQKRGYPRNRKNALDIWSCENFIYRIRNY